MLIQFHGTDAMAIVNAMFTGENLRVKLFADGTGIGFEFRDTVLCASLGRVLFNTDEALAKLETWAHDEAESDSLATACATLRAGFAVWQLIRRRGVEE
jgi:hypothetical protein